MTERRWLSMALVMALMVFAVALALRVIGEAGRASPPPSQLLPLLFAGAGLCTAGLLRHRSPAGAWLATVSAGGLAALEILGAVRAREASASPETWPWLVVVAQGAILASAGIAGLYAARLAARVWRAIVVAGLAIVAVGVGLAIADGGSAASDQSPFRLSARLGAGFVAVMTIAGALRDLAGPVRRAGARSRSVREWPGALAEELLPGAGAMRRLGRDEERARLAADLHALVLPDLRRAADAAAKAQGDAGEPVVAELKQALAGVERLIHERHSVVLEEYGLVAALEWLAERTQEQSPIEVSIELEGADVDDRSAIPVDVGRAAFRVAMLAIDNVVRHAGAAQAVARLAVDGGQVRLVISDDGRGVDSERSAPGGRGLTDMRAAAAEIGASFRVERLSPGTRIELLWSRPAATAGDHPRPGADLAARPEAPLG